MYLDFVKKGKKNFLRVIFPKHCLTIVYIDNHQKYPVEKKC